VFEIKLVEQKVVHVCLVLFFLCGVKVVYIILNGGTMHSMGLFFLLLSCLFSPDALVS
jgi:hypothetical protein